MAELNPHLFLNNPRGEKKYFDASRGRSDDETEIPDKPAQAYRPQKDRLNGYLTSLNHERAKKLQERTLNIPDRLEYIIIDFLVIFGNHDAIKTRDRFVNQFGLVSLQYQNFNQSVTFAITNEDKFKEFLSIIIEFVNSQDDVHPKGKRYNVATIIQDFRFLSTEELIEGHPEKDVILSLVIPTQEVREIFEKIFKNLINYLQNLMKKEGTISFSTDEYSTIEIKNIGSDIVSEIAKNFDIIHKIQSLRVPTITQGEYNQPILTWNINIDPPSKEVKIGIIDNGVKPIPPLKKIIIDYGLDITNDQTPNPLYAAHTHGTVVASLAALGLEYFDTEKKDFISDAYIVPIKILDFDQGYLNIYDIENVIYAAIKKGVKIFNLSVCGPCKNYNSSVSEYAYLLDRLAYKYDILIFIATGNLPFDDVLAMKADVDQGFNLDFHTYPNHFYNPNKSSLLHSCEATNICMPAESYNNVAVGAISENGIANTQSDLTLDKKLPAFYTRKHHIDYNQKVNGTNFKKSQKNFNINKPDIIMRGGDLLEDSSKMQVFGFGDTGDFYLRDSGTSFASPLATNIAAKILSLYPSLKMQSVKALILNSAEKLLDSSFLNDLINGIKEEESQKEYGKQFSDLTAAEKRVISSQVDPDILYHRLVGHGKPIIDKALFSSSKSVTTVIEDNVYVDSYKVIDLSIPEYLLKYSKSTPILILNATLCFKFLPVLNDQLGYNPLHISFNFIKSLEKGNPAGTSDIISNREHEYFNQFYATLTGDKRIDNDMKLDARNRALGIKTKIQSWSDDFSPLSNKPFSNVQKIDLNINKEEIQKVGNQISIVIRCTSKRDLDSNVMDWLKKTPHEFSVAINIAEKENDELKDYDLYKELAQINELTQIIDIETEGDIELDIESGN
jgi:subtilisin family serine protease